ncbi:protein enabled homolog [Schistocerca serialis cubense]|uniref:protein enabled homolog n=1 Tax=Schistocerca serialis cubense TaxID=2023355 RepID=UPI00214F3AF9|nr:protein enabled homolog [Schistocerca serialis cubense]
MWCDLQSPAMMGLQATASKRKLEYDSKCQPAKLVRLDEGAHDAAAADLDDWRLASALGGALASPVPHQHDDDEDDDDEEDDDEDDDKAEKYLPPAARAYHCLRYAEGDGVCYPHAVPVSVAELKAATSPPPPPPAGYYPEEASGYGAGAGGGAPPPYGPQARLAVRYQPSPAAPRPVHQYWGSSEYYSQNSQQTIRCDENGKSYLDLGSSSARYSAAPTVPARCPPPPLPQPPPPPPPASAAPPPAAPGKDVECCDGRTGWCGRGPDAACYRQRRLAVLNISMCKLGRYRQFPDPSLRRSVLICNTLRYIEREMEQEGCFFGGGVTHVPAAAPPPPAPTPQPPAEPEPSYQPHFADVSAPSPAAAPAYAAPQYRVPAHGADLIPPYEHTLRDFSASGRATPFPAACADNYDADSGVGDEESARGINWGSVLSLSSQSDLDPLNNNELYSPSPPHSSSSSFGFTNGDSNSSLSLLGDVDLGHEFDDFLPSWKLTPLSADDILKSVPPSEFSARQGEGELDSIMHVLVGT